VTKAGSCRSCPARFGRKSVDAGADVPAGGSRGSLATHRTADYRWVMSDGE
jgi:hypothetical protein